MFAEHWFAQFYIFTCVVVILSVLTLAIVLSVIPSGFRDDNDDVDDFEKNVAPWVFDFLLLI